MKNRSISLFSFSLQETKMKLVNNRRKIIRTQIRQELLETKFLLGPLRRRLAVQPQSDILALVLEVGLLFVLLGGALVYPLLRIGFDVAPLSLMIDLGLGRKAAAAEALVVTETLIPASPLLLGSPLPLAAAVPLPRLLLHNRQLVSRGTEGHRQGRLLLMNALAKDPLNVVIRNFVQAGAAVLSELQHVLIRCRAESLVCCEQPAGTGEEATTSQHHREKHFVKTLCVAI